MDLIKKHDRLEKKELEVDKQIKRLREVIPSDIKFMDFSKLNFLFVSLISIPFLISAIIFFKNDIDLIYLNYSFSAISVVSILILNIKKTYVLKKLKIKKTTYSSKLLMFYSFLFFVSISSYGIWLTSVVSILYLLLLCCLHFSERAEGFNKARAAYKTSPDGFNSFEEYYKRHKNEIHYFSNKDNLSNLRKLCRRKRKMKEKKEMIFQEMKNDTNVLETIKDMTIVTNISDLELRNKILKELEKEYADHLIDYHMNKTKEYKITCT